MKRGIAGSLIFTIFDRSALSTVINDSRSPAKYFARPTDVASPGEYSAISGQRIPRETLAQEGLLRNDPQGAASGFELFAADPRRVNYPDQIPPFDVVLSAQNEMGHRMFLQIFGVELLNQGSGVSVDD